MEGVLKGFKEFQEFSGIFKEFKELQGVEKS